MPQITIPSGYKVTPTKENTIKIRVPNTRFYVLGVKKENLWDIYLVDPQTNRKEIIRRKKTTQAFSMFSNIILKTPFPYSGKKAENSIIIIRFLKRITKTKTNK